jgi:hypothetical protein
MKFWNSVGKYTYNILISIDQRWNTILGGDPDETISSRLGKIKLMYGGTIPWNRPISKIVDAGLDVLQPNHSLKAIEKDEGKDSVLDTDCEKPYVKGNKV